MAAKRPRVPPPWRWVGELEATLRRVGRAFAPMLCAAPRSAWHMRPSRFEERVLQVLGMLGVQRVAREVCVSVRVSPEMRRAMAHAPSGAFHVPGTVALRFDMVWWDEARGLLRILEVDGSQHGGQGEGDGGAERAHFFFRNDPSAAHRARCRDLLKDAMVAAGKDISLLRVPGDLERPSHAHNVALIRTLHAWIAGPAAAPAAPAPAAFPLPPPSRPPGAAPRSRRRSASLPPPRSLPAVNQEEERRARTVFVRARRAAARSEAEARAWQERQRASDSRRMARDDALHPYPPRWWAEARRAGVAEPPSAIRPPGPPRQLHQRRPPKRAREGGEG
jgi:hypothetical protein